MSRAIACIVAGFLLLITGCGDATHRQATSAPPAPTGLSREEQVQVVVLERMLKNWGEITPAGQKRPQMNYLAVSDTLHLFGGDGQPRDPSDRVMGALGMWQAKRFSDCVVKKHERMPVSDRMRGFPGRILWVGPIRWVDEQTAETSAGVWENMKFGPGEMLSIRWDGGKWTITPIGGWDT